MKLKIKLFVICIFLLFFLTGCGEKIRHVKSSDFFYYDQKFYISALESDNVFVYDANWTYLKTINSTSKRPGIFGDCNYKFYKIENHERILVETEIENNIEQEDCMLGYWGGISSNEEILNLVVEFKEYIDNGEEK